MTSTALVSSWITCGFDGEGLIGAHEHINGSLSAAEVDLQALSIEKADTWILINDSKTAAVPLENRNDSNNVTPCPTDMYLVWVWHYELSLCGGFDHDHSLIFQSGNPIDILVSQIGVCEPQSQGRQ